MDLIIHGGPVFDGHQLISDGAVHISDGGITQVTDLGKPDSPDIKNFFAAPCCNNSLNTHGKLIMPGLVDLHSDSLERNIEKRKGVIFDVDFALLNLDRQLAAWGITSFFHAISFNDNAFGLRSPHRAQNYVRKIKAFNDSDQALVRHYVHLRYEIGSQKGLKAILQLLDEGLPDLISIMDHTPGQGQFRSMAVYMKYNHLEYGISPDQVMEKVRKKQEGSAMAWEFATELAQHVRSYGIPLFSHDDDTVEKVDLVHSMGITGCEFPITQAAALRAREHGMEIFMGSPNFVRDASSSGNLKASTVMEQGILSGLVSDYYPESLCQACFMAADKTGNPAMGLGSATSGPGRFVRSKKGTGTLDPGTRADIIVVDRDHEWAHITHTFVDGRQVFSSEDPRLSSNLNQQVLGAMNEPYRHQN